jgi:hypothetical protein
MPRPPKRLETPAGWLRAIALVTSLGDFACQGQIGELGSPVRVELLAPRRMGFESVADAMQPHCGTLDCHGQVGRNMRLFGSRGLRLLADANPADEATTPPEYDASFWSVVGLEPELMTLVIQEGGAEPERLSLIRKARGHEKHKGGTLMVAGDDLDSCLISWLTGPVPEARCRVAAMYGAPGTMATP